MWLRLFSCRRKVPSYARPPGARLTNSKTSRALRFHAPAGLIRPNLFRSFVASWLSPLAAKTITVEKFSTVPKFAAITATKIAGQPPDGKFQKSARHLRTPPAAMLPLHPPGRNCAPGRPLVVRRTATNAPRNMCDLCSRITSLLRQRHIHTVVSWLKYMHPT